MKFAYCGYDFFWNVLDTLVKDGHELLGLFSFVADNKYDFNDKVFDIAQKNNSQIKLTKITPDDARVLKNAGCDMLICAAYPYKIPTEVSECFRYSVNIHPSLLPEGRGPWPLPWIILKELTLTGVTIHKLSKSFDRGDILLQKEINVSRYDTLESLSAKIQICAPKLVEEFIANADKYMAAATPQEDGSYWNWPTKNDRTVDWDSSIYDINKIVRAFSKFEAYGWIEGKKYYLRDVSVWAEEHSFQPGHVVHRMNKELVIAAKDGLVCVRNFELSPKQE